MYCRGGDYRPKYKESIEVRSNFNEHTPIIIISATIPQNIYDGINSTVSLRSPVAFICKSPDRPNVFIDIVRHATPFFNKDLLWIPHKLMESYESFLKTLIKYERYGSKVAF